MSNSIGSGSDCQSEPFTYICAIGPFNAAITVALLISLVAPFVIFAISSGARTFNSISGYGEGN
ncbi:MAG: hypothetical protein A2Z50_07615 [Nitrospirae bacterium RBG_19FT_COMBO_42_15]|nr:MAG: hypothetical protein A2Z50_07615 [Nitrospirae bacterium RBG_19FT_COMBO_42_15]